MVIISGVPIFRIFTVHISRAKGSHLKYSSSYLNILDIYHKMQTICYFSLTFLCHLYSNIHSFDGLGVNKNFGFIMLTWTGL